MKKKTEKLLHRALLLEGKMEKGLFEYELEEHIDDWKWSLQKDKDEFLFVVTEMQGDVAMLLITDNDELYINEEARDQLKRFWKDAYQHNIEKLLPTMARQLLEGYLSVNGVKTMKK